MNDTIRIVRTLVVSLFFIAIIGAFIAQNNDDDTKQYSEVITIEEEKEPQGWTKTDEEVSEKDRVEEELRQNMWDGCMRACKTYGSYNTGNCKTDCDKQMYVMFGK